MRDTRAGPARRLVAGAHDASNADAQLMTLLRRLTAVASRPGELDTSALLGRAPERGGSHLAGLRGGGTRSWGRRGRPGRRRHRRGTRLRPRRRRRLVARRADRLPRGASSSALPYNDGLTGLMAVNLIRAHREELIQASTGKLDHMVIDVVGSLFDQILSDSRVPPQMAREIARLQLPVLRVALNDSTFFSTRRHPVRRFVNRIASLACAFDDFDDGPGRAVPAPRRASWSTRSSRATSTRSSSTRPSSPSSRTSSPSRPKARSRTRPARSPRFEAKESELRIQQRYMLQLRASLAPAQAAALPAGVPGPGLEPGAGPRQPARRHRFRPRASATGASASTS